MRMLPALLATGFCLAAATVPVIAAKGPSVDKSRLHIHARRQTSYFPKPGQEDSNTWSWTPRVDLRVNGPVSSGTMFYVDFTLPGNKPWVTLEAEGQEVKDGAWYYWDTMGNNLEANQGTLATGQMDFKVRMKNELEGTETTLLTGKYNVKKIHIPPNLPKHDDFYVDQDFNLPFGEVYGDFSNDQWEVPPLNFTMWFRGRDAAEELEAHLYYQGKEVSNTATTAKGSVASEWSVGTFDTSPMGWNKARFEFFNTCLFNKIPDNRPDTHDLDKNPGEYEVKVLRKGKLVRTAKFTVQDGKVVDNGLGQPLNSDRWVVPVKVTAPADGGTLDLAAWKTGAFFGNPLNGFVAP